MTGNRILNVRLTNVSDSAIDAYELLICPRDRFGEVVPRLGEECFKQETYNLLHSMGSEPPAGFELIDEAKPGIYARRYPNKSIVVESIIWRTNTQINFKLDRYDTATQATVELLWVHFKDATVWKEGRLIGLTPTPTPNLRPTAGSRPLPTLSYAFESGDCARCYYTGLGLLEWELMADRAGGVEIVGVVENASAPIAENVRVAFYFYDKNGHAIVKSELSRASVPR